MEKDRNLPPFKYFEQVQLEYIVAELRKKIYYKPNNRKYWQKVMDYKKGVIKDMSVRNSLPNIFIDEAYKIKMYQRIYNEKGLPNFLYRDKEQEKDLRIQDIENYFASGNEVKIFINKETIRIGKINSFNYKANLVEVIFSDDSIFISSMENITRIL